MYAHSTGFGVRFGSCNKYDECGKISWKVSCCNKKGRREGKNLNINKRQGLSKLEARSGCKAKIRFDWKNKARKWLVGLFNDVHNHKTVEESHRYFIRLNRIVDDDALAEAEVMKKSSHKKAMQAGMQMQFWYTLAYEPRGILDSTDFQMLHDVLVELEEFESAWKELVDSYELEESNWIKEKYKTKHMWAQVYISGQFFGTLRTISKSKECNSYLKYILRKTTLLEFLQSIEKVMINLRHLRRVCLE
ncbi:hypothetical protein REPUB_Repub17cG0098100 [Reevesia pubescens]